MRNKIIENAIDSVVNASNTSSDFKLAFRQYVKNKFDDNAKESDLKRILTLIEDPAHLAICVPGKVTLTQFGPS